MMHVLRLNRDTLVFLGLCSDHERPIQQLLMNVSIISLLIGFLGITMEFILTHTDDMADLMYAVMQFITFVTVTTCYICFSLKKIETFHFLEKLQRITNSYRKCFVSRELSRIMEKNVFYS